MTEQKQPPPHSIIDLDQVLANKEQIKQDVVEFFSDARFVHLAALEWSEGKTAIIGEMVQQMIEDKDDAGEILDNMLDKDRAIEELSRMAIAMLFLTLSELDEDRLRYLLTFQAVQRGKRKKMPLSPGFWPTIYAMSLQRRNN